MEDQVVKTILKYKTWQLLPYEHTVNVSIYVYINVP